MFNTYLSFDTPTGELSTNMKNKKIIKIPTIFSLIGFVLLFTTLGAKANVIENNTISPLLSPSQLATGYASDATYGRESQCHTDLGHGCWARGHTGCVNGVLVDNIAFFSQTGQPNNGGIDLTLDNCTRSNPCGPTDFSQTGVNTLNNLLLNTTMFFNGGRYALGRQYDRRLALNPGQSLHSRTADYELPATGAARSTFYDGILSLGGNNTVDSIIAFTSPDFVNLDVYGTNNVITGSHIGEVSRLGETVHSVIAIELLDGSQTLIDDSEIYADFLGIGVHNANLTIQNSFVSASTVEQSSSSYGLYLSNDSSANIQMDTTIRASNPYGFGSAVGIITYGSTSQVNNAVIQASSSSPNLIVPASAIWIDGGSGSNITSNSILMADGVNATVAGVRAGSTGRILINSSSCYVNGRVVPCPASTP